MWLLVMFDLPTSSPAERKAANAFRHSLLDSGFERVQFSVYAKFCGGEQRRRAVLSKVRQSIPEDGRVDILTFTDHQYQNIVRFENSRVLGAAERPKQFILI